MGADCIARGLSLNGNLALGWHFSGWVNVYLGNHEIALEHLNQMERLSPRDPALVQNRIASTFAKVFAGRYDDVERLTESITSEAPALLAGWRLKAVGYALAGNPQQAFVAARKVLELDPSARVSTLVTLLPLRRPQDRERYREGLLQAGIPA